MGATEDGLEGGQTEVGELRLKNNFFFLMFDLEGGRLREWEEYRTAF
jgi:hypothetical protein